MFGSGSMKSTRRPRPSFGSASTSVVSTETTGKLDEIGLAAGIATLKVVPAPGCEITDISPCCMVMISRTMDRPRPVP